MCLPISSTNVIILHTSIHLQQHQKPSLLRFSHILLMTISQIFQMFCTISNKSCPSFLPKSTFLNHLTASFRILLASKVLISPSSKSSVVFHYLLTLSKASHFLEDIVFLLFSYKSSSCPPLCSHTSCTLGPVNTVGVLFSLHCCFLSSVLLSSKTQLLQSTSSNYHPLPCLFIVIY